LKFDLPDKDVLTFEDNVKMNDWWTVYFDGAMNVIGNGTGTMLTLSLKFFPEQICTSKKYIRKYVS